MSTQEEKSAFARRLQIALNRLAAPNHNVKVVKGATDLARQFNLRYSGEIGISTQAAHKWLTGKVIPTNDKIKTLAEWLGVTEHWLHYGAPPKSIAAKSWQTEKIKYPLSSQTLKLIKEIEALSEHQRYLVENMVVQLLESVHKSCVRCKA